MAKPINTQAILLLSAVISVLLAVSMAETGPSRPLFPGFIQLLPAPGPSEPSATTGPHCDSVYGVKSGDTCFAVSQANNLTIAQFNGINPNLNCTRLFVGQWLCIKGTPN